MDFIGKFTERRHIQLEKTARVDDWISKLKCHETVTNYLLWRSKVNKAQYDEFMQQKFWNVKSCFNKQLSENDAHLDEILFKLENEDPCTFLKNYQ